MSYAYRTLRCLLSSRVTRPAAAAAALALVATGCADAPTAPAAAPAAPAATALAPTTAPAREIVLPEVLARVLTRSTPLPSAVKVIAIVGTGGGTFSIPQTGLTVTVPAGAVRKTTQITVTAPSGAGVWYEFGPSGTKFAVPLTLTQDLRATNVGLLAPNTPYEAGYFADGTLDASAGTAPVKEFLPVQLNATRTQLTWRVSHFSGYMVSTGRN